MIISSSFGFLGGGEIVDVGRDGVHTVSTFKVLQKQIDIMAIGLHTVVGQREFQPQIIGEVFDEVGGDAHCQRLLLTFLHTM